MKKILLFAMALFAVLCLGTSCSKSLGGGGGEVTGVRGKAWNEPQPYGMVLIKRGSMELGAQQQDSLWGDLPEAKGVSVDAFWMDEKEVSNAMYRQFVYYVRDSIIRERLADPSYGGNEDFKVMTDKYGEPLDNPYLNWSKPIPWRKPNEDELRAIESVYTTDPITGTKILDASQLNYRYESFDYKSYAQRRNRLDPERRNLNTDIPVDYNEEIIISKDTAFVDDEGVIHRQTLERPLSGPFDFLNTYIVNIYPDTTVWINDFANAYTEQYARYYFSSPIYDDYPVVGVSWEQANAFCWWRTDYLKQSYGMRGIQVEPFRLPTEAEWEYAARAGNNEQSYSWKTDVERTQKGCFNGNFKPGDGNYSQDGYIITSPVGAYSSNDFGLYDMSGNVAEWTSTAWTESGVHGASDLNPDYQYNAAKEDPYRLKRKVIRGGSWKDAKHYVRADIRSWEYQNEQRSFVGFRCVRTYLGNNKVVQQGAKKSKKGSSSAPKQRQSRQSGGGGGSRSVRR